MNTSYPLVGQRFRPPAVALCQILPSGAKLSLRREPDNPYDPNAIQVWLDPAEIPSEALGELQLLAQGYGWTVPEIQAQHHQLGYIAREFATVLAPQLDSGQAFAAALSFDPQGKTLVSLREV